MPHTQCNGISVYYEVHGEGVPLILISGLGGDRTFWQPSIQVLSSHFQVVVFDTRGIGKTDAPTEPYSMTMFADDLACLMDTLHLEKAHILGFSMGGNIALAFAAKYPTRILHLIIAVSFATMNKQTRLFLDAVLSIYEHGASTKQMFELIAPWLFSVQFLSDPANAAFLHYDENEPDQQPLYAWRNQYLAQQQFDGTSLLSAIKVPTLILAGEQDRLAHLQDSEILAQNIENAILEIIPHSGHLINYEYPDLFHKHVLDFLSK